MKKKGIFFLLVGLVIFIPLIGGAQGQGVEKTQACMQKLPPVIIINQDTREMNFSKSPRIDAFWNYEEKKRGDGYAQSYQNGSCFATVSLYDDAAGRLSNNKVKRELKEAVQFKQTRQDSKRIKAVRFYTVVGNDTDQVNVMMLGNYNNHFLKIRTTCQYLPRMSPAEHEKTTIDVTEKLAREVIMDLNACFEPQK